MEYNLLAWFTKLDLIAVTLILNRMSPQQLSEPYDKSAFLDEICVHLICDNIIYNAHPRCPLTNNHIKTEN